MTAAFSCSDFHLDVHLSAFALDVYIIPRGFHIMFIVYRGDSLTLGI